MLRLLGTPHYMGTDGPLGGLPEKAFVLFAAVVLEGVGRPVARHRLRALLWEDALEQRAGDNLRWLLSRIRTWQRTHAVTLLEIGREEVRLAEGLETDLGYLLSLQRVEGEAQLDRLVTLCQWELLAGIDRDGPTLADTMRHWRDETRRRFLQLVREASIRIAGATSEQVLRDLVAREADDEDLVQALLVRVAADKGQSAARLVYESTARRLREDFGAEPSVETRALFAQLVPAAVATAVGVDEKPDDAGGGIPRIVLLPPEVPVPVEPRLATIADGVVEDVILQLCRMRTFAMFAPHTARQVARVEPAAVAPLGITYVARTLLLPTRQGGLRLSLSLVKVATGSVVFGEQFDFEEAVAGARFAELAEAIASHLASAVERVEIAAYRRTGAASAYVQYLLGMRAFDNHQLPSLRRARRCFTRALELQPGYVPAMTAVARTLSKESLALRRPETNLAARAMSIAEEAARIDPLDPNAWREMGAASLYLRDVAASLEFLDAALSRARHHADIIAERAEVLVHASRPKEARLNMLEALALNPLAPDDYHWTLGAAEFFLGRYEQALQALGKMRNADSASRLIAAAAAMLGDARTATRYRERWMQIYPDSSISNFTQFMPHTSSADVDHYVEALRRAGFT